MWGPNVDLYFDHRAWSEARTSQEVLDTVRPELAMSRMTEDRVVAHVAIFLRSQLSGNITGQDRLVSCGEMAH